MRVTQYQHTFHGGEFNKWIFTVARHTCLSNKKRAFRHRATTEYIGDGENFTDSASSDLRMAFSLNDDPLEHMAKTEQTELLLKAIASLPEEFREALLLSEYEGLTYDEIGKITGTSLSTIRIRIYRAKARLRKMLLPILSDEADPSIDLPDAEDDAKKGKQKPKKKF
jgi:RNA polymerase sigma-70 factor (ECF subfamily)